LEIKWKSGGSNSADLFTKNLDGATFATHARVYMSDSFLSGEKNSPLKRRSVRDAHVTRSE